MAITIMPLITALLMGIMGPTGSMGEYSWALDPGSMDLAGSTVMWTIVLIHAMVMGITCTNIMMNGIKNQKHNHFSIGKLGYLFWHEKNYVVNNWLYRKKKS